MVHHADVQARLALRALWSPYASAERDGTNGKADDGEVNHGRSLFHKKMQEEVDSVLQAGLARRLKRLEEALKNTDGGDGGGTPANGNEVVGSGGSHGGSIEQEVQTVRSNVTNIPPKLYVVLATACEHASACAHKPRKNFGSSKRHDRLAEANGPPEKKEEVLRETQTMKLTMKCVDQSHGSRKKQIFNLKSQLEECQRICKKVEDDDKEAEALLAKVSSDPSCHAGLVDERMEERRTHIVKLRKDAKSSRDKANHYKALAVQQRAYLQLTDFKAVCGGDESFNRHPAGEVFVVPPPEPMPEDPVPEWDVGTAVANPYVCDSWPFEANVLAQRCNQEATLPTLEEESSEELADAMLQGSGSPFGDARLTNLRLGAQSGLNLRRPLPQSDDDDDDASSGDYDDDDEGEAEAEGPATSRSL